MEAKVDSWQVQVTANGEPVLTIGDNFLSGHNDVDEYAALIRNCAEHLLAFTGQSVIPCTYPDCLSARAVQVAGEDHKRGVVEGMERAANYMESLGMEWAAAKIREAVKQESE